MKKFVVLYMAPTAALDEMMKTMTDEKGKAGMDAWWKWAEDNKASIVDMGAPVGKNKRVTKDGVTDIRNEVTGFSVVQAESHEEAVKLFPADHPHFAVPGAYIEVLSWVDMPTK